MYADHVADPGDIFAFMQCNGIGTEKSVFWEAWALSLEARGNTTLAAERLRDGVAAAAQPEHRLTLALQRLDRRIAKAITGRVAISYAF
jgi:hypothetical protein